MENFEFVQRKRFELTCPLMENDPIYLFIFTTILTHLNLIDWCYFHWTDKKTLQLSKSAASHPTQDYTSLFCSFPSLPVSRTLGGVFTWLASHIFLRHLWVMIYTKHTSAQAALSCFTGTSRALVVMKSFRFKALLPFLLWARGEGFWENKICWGRSQSMNNIIKAGVHWLDSGSKTFWTSEFNLSSTTKEFLIAFV